MTVTGPPDDYTSHLKEAAHEALSMTDLRDVEICRLQEEVKCVRADNDRLRAANAGLQDALNRARGPEGELPDKVAAWLRTKGYEVRALEPKP